MSIVTEDYISDASLPARFRARYHILQKLGEGGVALVYKVLDRRENIKKALKVLKPNYGDDPRAVERFEEEFRILRSLRHPSLPRMFDYGISEEGHRCMVMEYIEGAPLSRYFEERKENLWLLIFEIAEALEFIHEHELLHLDLKPDNILVRRTNAFGAEKPLITLIDFGLAYRRESGGKVKVVGTPGYMAPEIISGADRITRAADYYSLGVTMYELLEGRLPFRGGLDAVLRAHLTKEPEFGREQVEYAELYPRVRALMSKDARTRLEAFEDLRRSLGTRTGGSLQELNRAYAMGYLDSLGFVGKTDLWERLERWVKRGAAGLQARMAEMQAYGDTGTAAFRARDMGHSFRPTKSDEKVLVDSALLAGKSGEIERRIRADLLAAAQTEVKPGAGAEVMGVIQDVPRILTLSGPPGSGKSHLIDALKGECLLRGMSVFVLGEGGDYDALVAGGDGARSGAPPVDPRSLIIDRFVRGWDRLQEAGTHGGALLVMDGYGNAPQEEREFLEYAGKRIELRTDENKEPGVFIVASGRSARLKRDVAGTLLRGEKLDEYVIPLPGHDDVERILAQFHGHMAGVDDRKRLGDYLMGYSESYGALIDSLRSSLVKRELEREGGRWRFAAGLVKPEKRTDTQHEYYRGLLSELAEEERTVVTWLGSHRGMLRKSDFEKISGVPAARLNHILESIRPYRIIDVREGKSGTTLGIVSEDVRDSVYRELEKDEKSRFHTEYLRFYGAQAEDPKICEAMTFHYECMGDRRMGLLLRMRALARFKQARDVFAVRRLCSEGIQAVQALRAKEWKDRKWHLERYFIKQWLEAEWMVSNYRGLIEVVRKYIFKRKRSLPMSFAYMYGMALRSVGEFKECAALVKECKKRLTSRKSEPYAKVLLLEAALLNNMGRFGESMYLLNNIISLRTTLNRYLLCKTYVYYVLNARDLGIFDKSIRYLKIVKDIAKRYEYYDDLLLAEYYETIMLLNTAQYSQAKKELKRCIKIASQRKLYFRLCGMYHLLSGVYFEEGQYDRASKYLDKSINIASDIGMNKWVNDGRIRSSFILQSMGYYADAILFAELANKTAQRRSLQADDFFSLIQLLALHTFINGRRLIIYKKLAEKYPKGLMRQRDMGHYYYTFGNYYYKKLEYDEAKECYSRAFDAYSNTGLEDDAVRALIKKALICAEEKSYKDFLALNRRIRAKLQFIESQHIQSEYDYLMMSYYYLRRNSTKERNHFADKCEKALSKIGDVELILSISSLLFRVNMRIGDRRKAKQHFNNYYKAIKKIISNYDDKTDVNALISSQNLPHLSRELRIAFK